MQLRVYNKYNCYGEENRDGGVVAVGGGAVLTNSMLQLLRKIPVCLNSRMTALTSRLLPLLFKIFLTNPASVSIPPICRLSISANRACNHLKEMGNDDKVSLNDHLVPGNVSLDKNVSNRLLSLQLNVVFEKPSIHSFLTVRPFLSKALLHVLKRKRIERFVH